jgi:Tol biopolymer transport system component
VHRRWLPALLAALLVAPGLWPISRAGVIAQDATPGPAAEIGVAEQRAIDLPDTRIISLSPDGRWLVAAKPADKYARGQLCVYDVETLAERACGDLSGLDSGLRVEDVVWSPDSARLAFAEEAFRLLRDGDIWLMDAATGQITDLTDEGIRGRLPILNDEDSDIKEFFIDVNPAWSPDGRSLAFSRSTWRDGEWRGNEIATIPAAGGTPRTILQVTTQEPGIVYFGIHWQADGSRLFYNLDHVETANPENGIWVVDADGQNARKVAGTTDPDLGPPAVVQVAPAGDRLLAFYILSANQNTSRGPWYALVDVASGQATPLTIRDPTAPEGAFVSLATLSPAGSQLLYVTRLTNPDHQVYVRDLRDGTEVRLIDGLPRAFTIAYGVIPTWAINGAVFMNSDLGAGTLIRLAGGAATPAASPVAEPPGTPESAATPTAALSVAEQRAIEIPDTRIISLSPDGRSIVAAKPIGDYQRGQLCVYDVATLAERACADLSTLEAGLRIEDVAWSPDGSHLAFAEQGLVYFRDGDLWLMDTATGALTNVDDDGYSGSIMSLLNDKLSSQVVSLPVNPTFSPDGRTIAFSRSVIRNGAWAGNEIALVAVDGGAPRTVTRVTPDTPGVVYFGIRWAPDAARLYYSVTYPDLGDARSGIWVVDADGRNQRQILGATDPEAGPPAVAQVSPRGDKLLAFYPVAMTGFAVKVPFYALVDVATGAAEPLLVPDPNAPPSAYVSLAAISPDGSKVLILARLTDPDLQVWARDVDGGEPIRLGEPLASGGPIGLGIIPTWATDGSVLITGDGELSTATLLRIEGSAAPPPVASLEPTPPAGTATPTAAGEIAPGATAIVNDDGVRLRGAPSRDAPVVAELNRGTQVLVLGSSVEAEGFTWWPIEEPRSRAIGWIRAEFLSPAEG